MRLKHKIVLLYHVPALYSDVFVELYTIYFRDPNFILADFRWVYRAQGVKFCSFRQKKVAPSRDVRSECLYGEHIVVYSLICSLFRNFIMLYIMWCAVGLLRRSCNCSTVYFRAFGKQFDR